MECLRQEIQQLQQANSDLEIALQTTTEHGDLIQGQLHELNQRLHAEIAERKATEEELRRQRLMAERLLLNILPQPIAERLKRRQNTIADSFTEVTVLFADIVNFTALSTHTSPTELVELLNNIFSAFDELADWYGLEKIKTIGDAYMVVGGLPQPKPDGVEAIANMGLDILQEIKRFHTPDRQPIELRIGIHTGSVVAGVIGTRKFSYDLWGDTVNIANRMESQGEAGAIQVTETVYNRLKLQYQFKKRGTIDIKGKGLMTTYWLESRLNVV
jgi:class 3 adenylate cyclase